MTSIKEGLFLQGFRVKRSRDLPEQKARLHEMSHEKSGARLIWLERPEENKTFSVSFKTIPQDDSGVFHILEHCVLGGSKKYKVKEPFAELLKNSVNTFLNAMTFSDKTMYPVASRNETDFFNLMEVYLDGVFNPAVLDHERIFRQEGWAYAFDQAGNPSYQGVVYNEMKGASSSLDRLARQETLRLLFPDSNYRFNSGGDPPAILDLTYEDFKAAHRDFYHPSNAYFFLDGQLPIEKVLEKLDKDYLDAYEAQAQAKDISLQAVRPGLSTHDYEINADEDPQGKCRLTLARLTASWEEVEKQVALQILCDALAGSNEAPLKKAILDQGLAQDFKLYLSTGGAQAWLNYEAHNCQESDFAPIYKAISDKVTALLEEGLNKEDLLASLNSLYYQELDPEEPRGIYLAISSLSSWLHGGDPALYLTRGRAFQNLKDKIQGDYFQKLLTEFLPDQESWVQVQSLPSSLFGQERDAREAARLAQEVAGWTQAQEEDFKAQAAALEAWQASPDSQEALASLPSLSLQDLTQDPVYLDSIPSSLEGITVLSHPSPAQGILYLKLYFDCSDTSMEELASLNFMAQVLGKLATQKRDAQALLRAIKTHIGQLGFSLVPMAHPDRADRCRVFFTVTCSVLDSEVDQALALIGEILTQTRFDDKAAIQTLMLQNREYLRQASNQAAHYFGLLRVRGQATARDAAREGLTGLTFLLWLKSFLADFETKIPAYQDWLMAKQGQIFSRDRLTLSLTGQAEEGKLEALIRDLPLSSGALPDWGYYQASYPRQEGVAIPAAVSYACLGCLLSSFGGQYSGQWLALEQILSLEFLWNKIRVQGGAYGAGFSIDRSTSSGFFSYRDPSPGKSLDTFRESAAFIQAFSQDKDSIERYIMGKMAALDPDLSYKAQADLADNWHFTGYGPDQALALRRQLMETKPQDLLPLARILDQAIGQGAVCLLGSPDTLAQHKDLSLIDIS